MNKILAIVGPTAIGKTAIAIVVAKKSMAKLLDWIPGRFTKAWLSAPPNLH